MKMDTHILDFGDMNLKNFNMNFADTKKKTSPKTLAVIQVHCYGIVSEIEKVKIIIAVQGPPTASFFPRPATH